MANNLNTQRIVQEVWASSVASYNPKWQKVFRDLGGPSGIVKVGDMVLGAVPQTIADSATSEATASDFASFQATFGTQEKVIKHTFASHILESDITLRAKVSEFAGNVLYGIDLDAFSGLEGLLTADHVRAGTDPGCVGEPESGHYKYIGAGKKGLYGESGVFTYSNKVSAAFSRASLGTAVALMAGWKNDRGQAMNLGVNGYTLVVNPADLLAAHEAVHSTLSSNAMQSNYFQGLITDIVAFPFVTSTTGWFLLANGQQPVGYRLARFPSVELREGVDGTISHLVAKFNGCFVYSPFEYGLVGSTGS